MSDILDKIIQGIPKPEEKPAEPAVQASEHPAEKPAEKPKAVYHSDFTATYGAKP